MIKSKSAYLQDLKRALLSHVTLPRTLRLARMSTGDAVFLFLFNSCPASIKLSPAPPSAGGTWPQANAFERGYDARLEQARRERCLPSERDACRSGVSISISHLKTYPRWIGLHRMFATPELWFEIRFCTGSGRSRDATRQYRTGLHVNCTCSCPVNLLHTAPLLWGDVWVNDLDTPKKGSRGTRGLMLLLLW